MAPVIRSKSRKRLKHRPTRKPRREQGAGLARGNSEPARAVMRLVLDGMGEGVALFDADFRLRFVEIVSGWSFRTVRLPSPIWARRVTTFFVSKPSEATSVP